ncbi:MAG: TAXI family TRAP transporter solute-binding subunit [Aminobacterium sp.]|nr:TAXI family TRAP transporter solute-binding subunit [Aminobacterium sp.]MDD2207730.1 TAXI family TRAP transporter solute-binding subunit [Aminobacterium sp.]MDD3427244.1 TAXI family TRAP transporter solute-binding subunit [Aminobacterium sp.]MDD3708667.1 TAXI family TRAP transporter solute-binding subunit [Aminobacterium sp.]MDD4229763.1 TAXI family TRAP transporter solute-binding subunit [Aminobacterium sp.]MDD4552553.1 TAXI family TRAP transporter solute-binding subunit [Aminobacterium sp
MIFLLTLTCVFTASVVAADTPSQLRFMAGPPGGNWFALGGALAELWSQKTIPTTSITGGAVANIINADKGKGDLGFSNTSMVAVAQKGGMAPFKDAVGNASILANLYTQYTYFIARKDFVEKNDIKSLDDLVARKIPTRFATLKTGTGSEFIVNGIFKSGFGVDYRETLKEWGGSVEYASYSGGADLIADNHLDVFAFSVGKVASIVMQIESQTDIVILGMEQKTLDKIGADYGTVTFTVDPGIYKSVTDTPVKVVGDYTCIVVRSDLDEQVVYDLCKTMYENQDTLAKAVVDMKELNPATAVPTAPIKSHPGAVKYWDEVAAK